LGGALGVGCGWNKSLGWPPRVIRLAALERDGRVLAQVAFDHWLAWIVRRGLSITRLDQRVRQVFTLTSGELFFPHAGGVSG
jgi:hypothetical protein